MSMQTRWVMGILTCLGIGVCADRAEAFALLGFPSDVAVQVGDYKQWQLDSPGSSSLSLSYSIQSDFLGGLTGAYQAADNALRTWEQASGTLDFGVAGYEPVVNSTQNWVAGYYEWEGAGAVAGSMGIGANVDIMSRSTGFQFDFLGQSYEFGPTTLAFTCPIVMGGTIVGVDIYLNDDFNWSTQGGNFDVETVVLHEIGHALGLDHPDQASMFGAANYDPFTLEPGKVWSTDDVMHSTYWPDGINRSLTNDEIGGLAFLYPGLEGDANLDGIYDFQDVQMVIDMFFGFAELPNAAAMQNVDRDGNGLLDFSDVDGWITAWFCPELNSSSEDYSVAVLQSMGYDTTALPEPGSLLLIFVAFSLGGRWGHRLK